MTTPKSIQRPTAALKTAAKTATETTKMLKIAIVATIAALAAGLVITAAHGQVVETNPMMKAATSPSAFAEAARTSSIFSSSAAANSGADLPEAPSALLVDSFADQDKQLQASTPNGIPGATPAHPFPVASKYTKYVPAGWTAQPINGREKFVLGVRELYSPFAFVGILAAAGYSHALNGQPNYGTDRGAFGQRIGATAIRDTSETFLAESVFAPLLHEDNRFYVQGNKYGVIHRALYAATRPILTRSDSGHTRIHASLILADAAATSMSYAYAPKINQNFHDMAATFGGSLGGSAVGDVVSEFFDSILISLHVKHPR